MNTWAAPMVWSPDYDRLSTADSLNTALNRGLALGIGMLLAITTLTRDYVGTPIGFSSRVVPVDLVCALLLAILFVRHRTARLPNSSILYVAALCFSLIPALLITPGPNHPVMTGFAAVLMAFAFYVAGLNIGGSPALLRWLLAGLCVGVLAEAVVVAHDLVSPGQWFPDPMEGRVRGTFKANGQLGAYGFCAGGILVTFGLAMESKKFRWTCVAAGLIAMSFVFPASRRAGMACVALWAGLLVLFGWKFSGRRFYQAIVASVIAAFAAVVVMWQDIATSFVGRRFLGAWTGMETGEGFIFNQMRDAWNTLSGWFPFGFGVAKGYRINPRDLHEVHNGFLAVAVEYGVLGFVGFAGMIARPLLGFHARRAAAGSALMRLVAITFMLSICVFMFHNMLYRDRTFLVFLGVATAWIASKAAEERRRDPRAAFHAHGMAAPESISLVRVP